MDEGGKKVDVDALEDMLVLPEFLTVSYHRLDPNLDLKKLTNYSIYELNRAIQVLNDYDEDEKAFHLLIKSILCFTQMFY